MGVTWYIRILAQYPCAILCAIFVLSSICITVPMLTNKFPDFSDPQLGFEARGTPLAQRLTAWQNLMDTSKSRGHLIDNPIEYYTYLQKMNNQRKRKSHNRGNQTKTNNHKTRKNPKKKKIDDNDSDHDNRNRRTESSDKWEDLMKLGPKNSGGEANKEINELRSKNDFVNENQQSEAGGFFCNAPSSAYARVVVTPTSEGHSLWSLEGILAQCHIDAALQASSHFSSLCQRREEEKNVCCRSWSPANFVAQLSNRTSCLGVTDKDLARVLQLLRYCAPFYRNLHLTPDCSEDIACQRRVPADCYLHNAAYNLLHYHLDIDFLGNSTDFDNSTSLRSAMLILPIAASSASFDFYTDLNVASLTYGKFHVAAMELGLKSTLFDRLLVSDTYLVVAGFLFVTMCIWSYTGSILLTISTVLAVIFSLGISYAFYTIVLRIKLFPFMNLLSVIVAIGIGADDAFIFCKMWERSKRNRKSCNVSGGIVRIVQDTMTHAIPSMFVTTLTTAVAFFASIISNVTAINCFSIFSGVTVIANFLLMITWLPASVVMVENRRYNILSPTNFIVRKIVRPVQLLFNKVAQTFAENLALLVINLRWLWIAVFTSMAIGSCLVIFKFPGLRLPDSPDFQLFDRSHIFEQYDLVYARRFWFERLENGDGGATLPMRFVWGVLPVDNGDYLNPSSRGTSVPDETFDPSQPESQVWLQNFCKNLRIQPFYRSTLGPLLPNCYIESLHSWMERRCTDEVYEDIDRFPCCERSKFPYEPVILRRCAAEALAEIHKTPSHLWNYGTAFTTGIKFLKEDYSNFTTVGNATVKRKKAPAIVPIIKIVVVEYDSTYVYSLSFFEMDQFYNEVEQWMQKQLKTAPPGMRNGWFVSNLEFYELQRTLYDGTMWAMVVSMGLAMTVLALVTLNPLVSLYVTLAIASAIAVAVASLVLLGWKLNVLESVVVSTAIGLAVDFSLHYGISYRTCESGCRITKVKFALGQMGGPTLMAAVTSGAAGAFVILSRVLAYIQIGVFLLIIMATSWVFATFYLCSLLSVAGPASHFAQFRYPRFRSSMINKNKSANEGNEENEENEEDNDDDIRQRQRNHRGAPSEFSTSSTVYQYHCADSSVRLSSPD